MSVTPAELRSIYDQVSDGSYMISVRTEEGYANETLLDLVERYSVPGRSLKRFFVDKRRIRTTNSKLEYFKTIEQRIDFLDYLVESFIL